MDSHSISYITLEQILIIHEDQIDRYGGIHGIRDLTLLESALYRPQTTFSGKELYPGIVHKAAALVYSLIMNHPFTDGNKRTGITAMNIFLGLNGKELYANEKEIVELALKIADKKSGIEEITDWLKSKTKI